MSSQKEILKSGREFAIVKYSDNSIVIFSEEKWGKEHKEEFKKNNALWNGHLIFNNYKGGWIFRYNSDDTKNYFKNTFDLDLAPNKEKVSNKIDESSKVLLYHDEINDVYVVKYSDKSIAIFSSEEWGKNNKNFIKQYNGTWSPFLSYVSPNGQKHKGAWMLLLSNENTHKYLEITFSIVIESKGNIDDDNKILLFYKPAFDIYVVKYGDKSIVIFSSEEWGKLNKDELKNFYGTWNRSLTYTPRHGEELKGGWTFKSKDEDIYEYLEKKFKFIIDETLGDNVVVLFEDEVVSVLESEGNVYLFAKKSWRKEHNEDLLDSIGIWIPGMSYNGINGVWKFQKKKQQTQEFMKEHFNIEL